MVKKPETAWMPAIIDGHVDLVHLLMESYQALHFRQLVEGPVTLAGLSRANVRLIVCALYCPDEANGPGSSTAYLSRCLQCGDEYLSGLVAVKTRRELQSCYGGSGQVGRLLLLENADALADCRIGLEDLGKRGLKVVGLTHAGSNRLADGNEVAASSGLTAAGRDLIHRLEREGFALDVAHLSDRCFWEAVSRFQGPLISSHTGLRRFCPTARNLDEEQLEAIFERGGVIGISANPEMLSLDRQAGIEDVLEQIDWLIQRYGQDCVGLGTDFCGFSTRTRGLEDAGELGRLVTGFLRRGYPAGAIEKLMGGNWYSFYFSLLQD